MFWAQPRCSDIRTELKRSNCFWHLSRVVSISKSKSIDPEKLLEVQTALPLNLLDACSPGHLRRMRVWLCTSSNMAHTHTHTDTHTHAHNHISYQNHCLQTRAHELDLHEAGWKAGLVEKSQSCEFEHQIQFMAAPNKRKRQVPGKPWKRADHRMRGMSAEKRGAWLKGGLAEEGSVEWIGEVFWRGGGSQH